MAYTSSQPLPLLEDMHPCIGGSTAISPTQNDSPPVPHLWALKYIPENLVYTDGSDIDGHPRLGASVVTIPTATTIYIIDAIGAEEPRTIMRAELVAIHMALTIFASHEWIEIFANSLSSLQAIDHHNTNPGIGGAKHYHHYMLLLESIT